MVNRLILYAVIAIAAAAVGLFIFGGINTGNINATSTQNAQNSGLSNNTNATLLSSTPYARYAYPISGSNLSAEAQQALSGFNMTKVDNANGTKTITLSLTGTNQNQTINLKQGEKLYIVETTFGDDSYNFDTSLGDDGFVVVNATGYIVG